MSSIEFAFENPWLLLVALPAALVVLFPFFLLGAGRPKTVKRVLPLVLHLVLILLLTLVMSGFHIIKHTDDQAVMLLLDMSGSTAASQKNIEADALSLLSKIDPDVPVGVVVFGGDSKTALTLADKKNGIEIPVVNYSATDLEGAMEYAVSLAPTDRSLRLVLFTDGKQTDGDADSMAYKLATRGIRIDAVYYDTTKIDGAEAQISSFSGPVGVYKDKNTEFLAEIKSNYEGEARLTLRDGNNVVWEEECTLAAGSNLVEISVKAEGVGTHTYTLVLEPEKDTYTQNNSAICCVNVAGEPSVLIIGDTMEHALAVKQMMLEKNNVSCILSRGAPNTLAQLCCYDAVVLANVQYYDLPLGYDRMLESYVADYGRGLLMVGGKTSLVFGNMKSTRLEAMMPVKMELEEDVEGKSVALMLVLDCSGSMEGENIRMAKQGAIKCMEAMTANDYVGVVSFERHAKLQSELIKADADNKEQLSRVISQLRVGSGTYYADALQLASDELRKSDADIKHILFLSDGQPSDGGYYEIVEAAAEDGITVSAIGLGFASSALNDIATLGKGRYYPVVSESNLPDVMLSETEHARANPLIIAETQPMIKVESALTDFLEADLPSLGGYLGTTLKNKATAYIVSPSGHPLYAAWSYGFGRVSCFTSDLHGEWSSAWQESDDCAVLVSNMIAETVNSEQRSTALSVSLKSGGGKGVLSVQSADTGGENQISVLLEKDEIKQTYQLWQAYPGMFTAEIELEPGAVYQMTVVETALGGSVIDRYTGSLAVPYSPEYDVFAPSGRALLASVCGHSDGEVDLALGALAKVEMPGIRNIYDPVVVLAVLILILLLADIAVRKLRWRDVTETFLKIKCIFTGKQG